MCALFSTDAPAAAMVMVPAHPRRDAGLEDLDPVNGPPTPSRRTEAGRRRRSMVKSVAASLSSKGSTTLTR